MQNEIALGIVGAVATLSLSAVGSAFGTGRAASAAVGAWKKCYVQGKQAPFILLSYVGAPLTQTLYGMILMFRIADTVGSPDRVAIPGAGLALLILGIFAGTAIGFSAYFQGLAGAGSADAQAETGEGLTNNLSVLGIVETVAIFVMVFTFIAIGNLSVPKDAADAGASSAIERSVELPVAAVTVAD